MEWGDGKQGCDRVYQHNVQEHYRGIIEPGSFFELWTLDSAGYDCFAGIAGVQRATRASLLTSLQVDHTCIVKNKLLVAGGQKFIY